MYLYVSITLKLVSSVYYDCIEVKNINYQVGMQERKTICTEY